MRICLWRSLIVLRWPWAVDWTLKSSYILSFFFFFLFCLLKPTFAAENRSSVSACAKSRTRFIRTSPSLSVPFSSRWYLPTLDSPYALHPVSHGKREDKFVRVAFETVPVLVWLAIVLSRPFKEGRRALPPCTPLSSLEVMDRAMYVHGFVPASSVWSSSTLNVIQASCDGCMLFSPAPVYLLGHFRSLQLVQGSKSRGLCQGEGLGWSFHFWGVFFVVVCFGMEGGGGGDHNWLDLWICEDHGVLCGLTVPFSDGRRTHYLQRPKLQSFGMFGP